MRHLILLGAANAKWISSKGEFHADDLSDKCVDLTRIMCDGEHCGRWSCENRYHGGSCEVDKL